VKPQAEEANGPGRAELEDAAERVRARLTSDIDELKRRGRRLADGASALEAQLKRHPGVAIGVAVGAVVALGLVLRARRARRRREERRDALIGLAARLLGPAYVVKTPEPKPGPVRNALAQAARELAVAAGREVGRRALAAVTGSIASPSEGAAEGPA